MWCLSKQILSAVTALVWCLSKQTLSPISSLKSHSLSKDSLSLFDDVLRPMIPKAALQPYKFVEEYKKSFLMLGLKKASVKEIPNSRVKEITFH